MNNLECPACGGAMARRDDPDLAYEICGSCGGIHLDAGELNALATGMAGDIEYCSLLGGEIADAGPRRHCPRCGDVEMDKVNLLRFSDTIFEHCAACGGFFLDAGELKAVNRELDTLGGRRELREHRDGRLVRLDRIRGAVPVGNALAAGSTSTAHPATHLRLTVYLKEALDVRLRVTPEGWTTRVWRFFGFGEEDELLGDEALDNLLIVRADSPEKARGLLTAEPVRALVRELFEDPPIMVSPAPRAEIREDRIMLTEGPYETEIALDFNRVDAAIERLQALAGALERGGA